MYVPEIFGRNVFDDFFDHPFGMNMVTSNAMKTDVKETDNGYELTVDLPGVKKENVKAELNDGYLTISAETTQNNDEKDSDGNYIRRERCTGSCSRSFYVGDGIKQEDIRARFADGVLQLDIPKAQKTVARNNYIAIE